MAFTNEQSLWPLSEPRSAEVRSGKVLPVVCVSVCALKQVCVCVFACRTLWVVGALGEISEVPDPICLHPASPHISGDGFSHPPGLKFKKEDGGLGGG